MGKMAEYDFEIPPKLISKEQVAEVIEAEVIIVGAGTAGLVCANSAAENGLSVILISASSHPIARGGSTHAINSRLMRELGVEYDVGRNFKQEMDRAGGRIDQEKWYLFAKKSGEAMDWLLDKMEAAGYIPVLERGGIDPDGLLSTYTGSHCFVTDKKKKNVSMGQPLVVKTLANTAKQAGVQIHYKIIAKQLVRENNNTGRVTSVIAMNSEGKYFQYSATKAIVLATGDFTKDTEMVSKYCPEVLPLVGRTPVDYNTQFAYNGIYAGDGHKMALWIGASWQHTVPNAPMIRSAAGPSPQPYQGFKGLMVNKNAVRYCNEDMNNTHASFIQMRQPKWMISMLWDSAYAERMAPWYPQGSSIDDPEMKIEEVFSAWEAGVKTGTILKAETLEELAKMLDLDFSRLKSTVDRYNEFCNNGVDEDFYKAARLLAPVAQGPFYGQPSNAPVLLIVCGGLRTNIDMQVLDKRDDIIPGLYAAGTIVGDMFANTYSYLPSGINIGSTCLTFPYLIGKKIAES